MRALLVVVLILGGCASQQEEGRITDRAADEILYEADTPELRALRACQIGAMASEMMTYRLLWFPSEEAQRRGVASAIDRALETIDRIQAEHVWFETEMFLASVLMAREVGGATKERVTRGLADGFSWLGLLREIRITTGQAALVNAMVLDVNRQVGDPPAVSDEVWQSCRARLAFNRGLLLGQAE